MKEIFNISLRSLDGRKGKMTGLHKKKVGKKGVVRDPKVHEEGIEKVRDYAMSIFMEPCHLPFLPSRDLREILNYLPSSEKTSGRNRSTCESDVSVEDVVKEAHGQLD